MLPFQLCIFVIFQSHQLISLEPDVFLWQSLRARTEKALVKKQMDGNDSRMIVKQILSFTLNEKVYMLSLNEIIFGNCRLSCVNNLKIWFVNIAGSICERNTTSRIC